MQKKGRQPKWKTTKLEEAQKRVQAKLNDSPKCVSHGISQNDKKHDFSQKCLNPRHELQYKVSPKIVYIGTKSKNVTKLREILPKWFCRLQNGSPLAIVANAGFSDSSKVCVKNDTFGMLWHKQATKSNVVKELNLTSFYLFNLKVKNCF